MKRFIRNCQGDFIGDYTVLENKERIVFYEGKQLVSTDDFLSLNSCVYFDYIFNQLDNVIDEFEEGFNQVVKNQDDGKYYEILEKYGFSVLREVSDVNYY